MKLGRFVDPARVQMCLTFGSQGGIAALQVLAPHVASSDKKAKDGERSLRDHFHFAVHILGTLAERTCYEE